MFVKDLQCWKHPLPKEVTEEGIVMLVKPLHSLYLEVTDYQLFMVNTVEKWIGFYL